MKKCLLCDNEITYDKTICRDCWVELKEKYFENEEYYDETDILERYESLLKKSTKNSKPIKQLAELAVAYYYRENFLARDNLLERIEEDVSSMDEKTNITRETNHCPICGTEISEDKSLCITCWREARKGYKEFEHEDESEVREHYFNQKRATYRIHNDEYAETSKRVMAALAVQMYYDFDDNYLLDRLISDIGDIEEKRQNRKESADKTKIEQKNEKEESKIEIEDYRKAYPANIRCKDGHYVRSKSEKIIDDWLYDNDYLHIYEKQVYAFNGEEEQIFIPDFFLKKENLYIEFWGSEERSYLFKKKQKENFYKENDLVVIGLEDKHIEHIDDVLPREIAKNKKK